MIVNGTCANRFERVQRAFEANLSDRGDIGAAVAVVIDGETVVDLWGGHADIQRSRPWERDTLVNVWSTTKGIVAAAAHLLVERDALELDAPVASYWPEFAQAGKATMPFRYLLSHQAGLCGVREPLALEDLYDWEKMTSVLAAAEPWWEPGTESGYHALTYGYLVGEVIRRITGLMPGAFIAKEITGPLDADFHIGLPASEHHRVADLHMPPPAPDSDQAALFAQLDPSALSAIANPVLVPDAANSAPWREAEIPAANGHGTARAIAAVYSAIATNELLTPETVDRAREPQGPPGDRVLGIVAPDADIRIVLGWWLSGEVGLFGPNSRAFGHDGYGGSFGMADPEKRLAMAWVMNEMGATLVGDPRKVALIDAVYASLP